jgi:arylsulfatase A-like enzyme
MQYQSKRREFLKLGLLSSLSTLAAPVLSCMGKNPTRPNVILLITDDQGYGDFGHTGNPIIQTPNLDALAKDSAEMSNYYVSPVCAPTRACLMTGRYNYRTRAIDTFVGRAMMDTEEVTVAEILNKAGYATGIFGKWHLGDNFPMRPQDQGFEETLVHRGGGIGQPSDPVGGEGKYTDPILFHNGKQERRKGYCTDIYYRNALKWIKKQTKAGRNFFAYVPSNAPHGPYHDVPPELLEKYKQMNLESDQFPQDIGHKLPEKTDTDKLARIFAMITNIDENVGRLRKELENLGLDQNTLIIFMVDNGPNTRRYVAGMQGSKTWVHEGGVHSPLFVCYPPTLQPGFKNDRVVAHIDMLPTILEVCGVKKPLDLKLDGKSFWPLLKGENPQWPDRNIVIQAHRGDEPVLYHNFMLRNQKWKLLHGSGFGIESFEGGPKFELYDMENDPLEMNNLAAQLPDKLAELKTAYEKWFKDVGSTRPDNYGPARIFIGTEYENPVVLTRQDWRHTKGRPWAPDSNGSWKLFAAATGKFNIRVRFKPADSDGKLIVNCADQEFAGTISKGQTQFKVKSVLIKKGNLDLQATMYLAETTKGPWQVDVIQM